MLVRPLQIGATMTEQTTIGRQQMAINRLTIKQPEYDCPVHGKAVDTISFNRVETGAARVFCIECCFDKMIEIGVCEVTEKKP